MSLTTWENRQEWAQEHAEPDIRAYPDMSRPKNNEPCDNNCGCLAVKRFIVVELVSGIDREINLCEKDASDEMAIALFEGMVWE